MLLFHERDLFALLFICIFSCRALYDWRGVFPCKCFRVSLSVGVFPCKSVGVFPCKSFRVSLGFAGISMTNLMGFFPWKLVPRSILSNSNVTYQEHGAVKYF